MLIIKSKYLLVAYIIASTLVLTAFAFSNHIAQVASRSPSKGVKLPITMYHSIINKPEWWGPM